MSSNTKLTKDQKQMLKTQKAENPTVNFLNNFAYGSGRTTIAYRTEGPDNIRFSTAIMGTDEIKFRKKVGQYYAMARLLNCESVLLQNDDFDALVDAFGV